jgi:hypothetical protein
MRSSVGTVALAVLAVTQLAFVPPNFHRKARTREALVTVVNSGDMYDLINSTDCIPWPNEDTKALGGQSGWKGWTPKNGDRGTAIARTKHCFLDRTLVFVKIGDYFVAMGSDGVHFDAGALDDLPLLTK